MRGRSYTPSPPKGYGKRGRSPSPRYRYGGGRGRDAPTSLLVRNLRHDCRPEDLRRPFGQFGPLKDIYLPRDYYNGEPRGFGFVQYVDPTDAVEAKYQMDGQILLGRQLTVVFAEENRKKPVEMRSRERTSRGRYHDRRRSPPRYSRSPQPRYARSRSRSHDYYSPPPKRAYSRSISGEKRRSRETSFSHRNHERSYSRSPIRPASPPYNDSRVRSCSPARERSPYNSIRDLGHSPMRERSPPYNSSRNRSRSPVGVRTLVRGRSKSRSRSMSAGPPDYTR